jgi:segregation and condensation protein B
MTDKVQDTALLLYAILFAAPEPLSIRDLKNRLSMPSELFDEGMLRLREIVEKHSPLDIHEVNGKLILMTRPEYGELIKAVTGIKKTRLSEPALHVLTYIAYNQPVFKSAIDELRGVDSESTLETLRNYGLIEPIGSAKTAGAPIAYKTTEKFLQVFQLKSLSDLPLVDLQ